MCRSESKNCEVCGRAIDWRKKWERDWDSVRYCSSACRARKGDRVAAKLEAAILELLDARTGHDSICPSEAARKIAPDDWRDLMEATRMAARRLANRNQVEITQKGKAVDPTSFRGPVRLRKPVRGSSR